MKTKTKYVYIDIKKESVMLLLLSEVLGISAYGLFLLYETFGMDVLLFFDLCKKMGMFTQLTDFRIARCTRLAEVLTPVLLGGVKEHMSKVELKSYRLLNSLLYEDKFRVPEDLQLQ